MYYNLLSLRSKFVWVFQERSVLQQLFKFMFLQDVPVTSMERLHKRCSRIIRLKRNDQKKNFLEPCLLISLYTDRIITYENGNTRNRGIRDYTCECCVFFVCFMQVHSLWERLIHRDAVTCTYSTYFGFKMLLVAT